MCKYPATPAVWPFLTLKMNFHLAITVGFVVVLSASCTSENSELEESVPKQISQRQLPKCDDCKSNVEVPTVITAFGSLANVLLELIKLLGSFTPQLVANDTKSQEEVLKSVLEGFRSGVPAVLTTAKNSIKILIPCPQVDQLFDQLNTNIQDVFSHFLKDLPLLMAAKEANKLQEHNSKITAAIKPILTKMIDEFNTNLLASLGLCEKLNSIISQTPSIVDGLLELILILTTASALGSLPKTVTDLVAGKPPEIAEILQGGLAASLSGTLPASVTQGLKLGLPKGLGAALQSMVNVLMTILKQFLAKVPFRPSLGKVTPSVQPITPVQPVETGVGLLGGLLQAVGSVIGLVGRVIGGVLPGR